MSLRSALAAAAILLSACRPQLESINLMPARPGIPVGETESVSVYINHYFDRPGTPAISFVSDDPAIARVDSASCSSDVSCTIELTGMAIGTTTVRGSVTVQSEEASAEFLVDVFRP